MLGGLALATAADPYVPSDNNEVLETLPVSLLSSQDELAPLRRQLRAEPSNAALATEVASRYLKMGGQEGDPRFYGYARAALAPWWDADEAPAEILQLRAKLKERDHLYDHALADLDLLIKQQPQHVQAWVERINILRVQGKYKDALQAIEHMSDFAGESRTLLCRVPIQAVTGQAKEAYDTVTQLLPVARRDYPDAVQWVLTMQSQIAWALGLDAQAERHFQEGLDNSPGDQYLLRGYADFLLDRKRDEEAFALLLDHTNDNGILLRTAIAARRLGKQKLVQRLQSQLESRFEEIRLRGSEPHGRFEARYLLELQDQPQRALELALANWQKQKEQRDTRNVLEAAVAARDPAAAISVVRFLRDHGTEDEVLERFAMKLEQE